MPKTKNNTLEPITQYQKRKNRRAELERKANGIHAERAQVISDFVKFDYDLKKPLSKYKKSKIKKYFDAITQLKKGAKQVYKPRIKEHLKIAQDYSGHPEGLSDLKVAFVPSGGIKINKFTFKDIKKKGKKVRTELILKTEHVITRFIPFDKEKLIKALANDSIVDYVNSVIKNDTANEYAINTGQTAVQETATRAKIAERVAIFVKRYIVSDDISWIAGLNAYTFDNQEKFDTEQVDKIKNKDELARLRKNKRALQRYYDKKKNKTKNKK
tara:strand:+ start:6514 stop:7326 length:813 start_codon:yes stop_codon:yes gene_type:complete